MVKVIIALFIIVVLGFLPRWHFTLSGDLVNFYYQVASHVWNDQTLIYPPGANLFFLLLPANSIAIYQGAFLCVNMLLIFFLLRLTKKPNILYPIILCAGPIILFRFDLLVITLLAISITAFWRNKYSLSGLFLGAAVAVKLFPLVLLPYFLLVLLTKKNNRSLMSFLVSFLSILGLIVFSYTGITNQGFPIVFERMKFTFTTPIHMESVLGSVLTIVTSFTNPGPHGVEFNHAIWALSPLYFLGHDRVFGLFGLLTLTFTYVVIFANRNKIKSLDVSTCLFLILMMVISSKLFSPQYLIWIAFLFTLIKPENFAKRFWKINYLLVLVALVCTQIIYPLNYGELIDFFNLGKNTWLFVVLATRNLVLVILAARLLKNEILPLLSKENSPASVSRQQDGKK